MHRRLSNCRGLATIDLVIALTLLLLAGTLLTRGLTQSETRDQQRVLQGRLEMFRGALQMYHHDHGFYPGSGSDYGYPLSDESMQAKLMAYTDDRGQVSETRTYRFRYGPYLQEIPVEPFGDSNEIRWALRDKRGNSAWVGEIHSGAGDGGWFYAPETGTLRADLGKMFPETLAGL
jgi:type II secretory pathway pseudopilin PulG